MNPKLTCSQRQWLHSSVGRASHRYHEVTGSSPVEVLNFFQASLRNCKNCDHNCGDHSSFDLITELCEQHNIKQVFGAPRTPTIQGLVERNNLTVKENITNILKERDQNLNKWCKVFSEAAYKKNISLHRAINKVPYEVVFGMLPWKEIPLHRKKSGST